MRIGVSLLLALLINALLFTLMQQMVVGRRIDLANRFDAQLIDFIRSPDQNETTPERRVRRPPPEQPEPEPPKSIQLITKSVQQPLPMPIPALKLAPIPTTIYIDAPYLGPVLAEAPASEGVEFVMAHDLIPILRTPPRYPRALKRREVKGYVVVEFTVNRQGRVQDPVILSADARPY